ncbi:hypothetical protein BC829DRAFT_413361 [Chytridium lagenaria]|nr:hypothetical protein BC829DRAFT_413361 [Chytridium lagenaria]
MSPTRFKPSLALNGVIMSPTRLKQHTQAPVKLHWQLTHRNSGQTFSVGLLRKLHPQNNACNGPPSIDQVNVIMAQFKRVVASMNIMIYWMWKLLGDVAVRECDEILRRLGFLEEIDGAAPLPHATSFPVDLLTTTTRYHIGLNNANEIQLPPAVMPVDEDSIAFPFSNVNAFFSRHFLRDAFRAVYQDPRINHDYVMDNEPSPRRTIVRTWATFADYDPNQLGTTMAPGPPSLDDPANPIGIYCRNAIGNMPRK